MAISGAVAAVLIAGTTGTPVSWVDVGGSAAGAVAVALVFSVAAGAFNGLLVGRAGIQPIVATLVLMVAGRGFAQLITNGQIVIFNNSSFESIGNGALLGLPVPIFLFAGCCLLVVLFVRKTALGLFIEAVGSNSQAARLTGIPTGGIKMIAYSVCSLMAGIAGIIACANIRAADSGNTGLYLELDAILAVCIGGTSLAGGKFSIAGSVIGAIVMQTLTTTILMRDVSPHATLVAKALIVVLVVLLQSAEFRKVVRLEKRLA
jgi:simple sugar transport system permease protein